MGEGGYNRSEAAASWLVEKKLGWFGEVEAREEGQARVEYSDVRPLGYGTLVSLWSCPRGLGGMTRIER